MTAWAAFRSVPSFVTLSLRLYHLPPSIPLSRVASMRSVQTSASVHAHWGATSLPCLARGTPGRLSCFGLSFTLSPSCPPSLHGRYSLHRYYGDSDSCAAPIEHRHRSPDFHAGTFQPRPLQPPLRSEWSPLERAVGTPFAWLAPRASPWLCRLAVSGLAVSSSTVWSHCFGLSRSLPAALHDDSHHRSCLQLPRLFTSRLYLVFHQLV